MELEQNSDNSFYANLAEDLTESSRHKLSTYLLEAIDEDIEARKDWLTSVQKVKEYLGFSLEDLQGAQFTQATRTFDTTLSTALIRFYATTRAELLPQSGPAGFKIQGEQNEALEKQGELICNWLNYFLTISTSETIPSIMVHVPGVSYVTNVKGIHKMASVAPGTWPRAGKVGSV